MAFGAIGVVLVALYFLQSANIAPNHTDEGLILGFIDDMARGRRPFYDFVDVYGLLNWVGPVLFYELAGSKVIGVRIWLVLLKVISVVVTYLFVAGMAKDRTLEGTGRRSRDRLYAVLAAAMTTVLLGAQWQSLQTAYAFLTVIPIVVGTWHFLLVAPFRDRRWNVVAAGGLTAAAIWTKLNTGMFLLAGGLFTLFFWLPWTASANTAAARGKLRVAARIAGLVAYVALFMLFIWQHFSAWFFAYLLLPLLLGLAATAAVTCRAGLAAAHPLRPFFLYLVTAAALSLVTLLGYYGRHAPAYARELAGIIANIRYAAPFPPLGEAGPYVGLNEYYWLQLPWLATALFVVWLVASSRVGPVAHGAGWPRRRARTVGLFVLVTLHCFVIYARADETHIYQALVLVVPVVFVLLGELDALLSSRWPRWQLPLRYALTGLVSWYSLSLAVIPEARNFAFGRHDWKNPKLAHLQYRRDSNPYVRNVSRNISDRRWDSIEDQAAAYIRSITRPDEEMLLLTANRLMYLNSGTQPVGGRFHFYFYLASVGLLDRQGFDRLVPREIVQGIVDNPPRVLVAAFGYVPLALLFPEFAAMRDELYERTRTFGHIWVYELRQHG